MDRATAAPTKQWIKMLNKIGSMENVPAYVNTVKEGKAPARGLRPPGLQEFRSSRDDHQEGCGRGLRGHRQKSAARHRLELERSRSLTTTSSHGASIPNVDFLLGTHLSGDGLSHGDVHRALRHPRTSGWLAHFQELLQQDTKIAERASSTSLGRARLRADEKRSRL